MAGKEWDKLMELHLKIPHVSGGRLYIVGCTYKRDIYCPNCGNKGLWEEPSGDFYDGPTLYCISCMHACSINTIDRFDRRIAE